MNSRVCKMHCIKFWVCTQSQFRTVLMGLPSLLLGRVINSFVFVVVVVLMKSQKLWERVFVGVSWCFYQRYFINWPTCHCTQLGPTNPRFEALKFWEVVLLGDFDQRCRILDLKTNEYTHTHSHYKCSLTNIPNSWKILKPQRICQFTNEGFVFKAINCETIIGGVKQ